MIFSTTRRLAVALVAVAAFSASAIPASALDCYGPPFPHFLSAAKSIYYFTHPSGRRVWVKPGHNRTHAGDTHRWRTCGWMETKDRPRPKPKCAC